MNLIDEEIVKLNQLSAVPNSKILIIVAGNNCRVALNSIQNQLYTNFEIFCIKGSSSQPFTGRLEIDQIPTANIIKEIGGVLAQTDADYIYLLDGEDSLSPNALLEYAIYIEEKGYPDLIYANEAFQYGTNSRWLNYHITPMPSNIAFFQSLFIGAAMIWKRKLLKSILDEANQDDLELLHQELFVLAFSHKCRIVQLPKILLIRVKSNRIISIDNRLLTLLQNNINIHTNWTGRIGRTSSYGIGCFELYSEQPEIISQVGFLIIENVLERTLQLLSQLSIFCRMNEIVIAVWENDKKEIKRYCDVNRFSNINIINRTPSYVDTLSAIVTELKSSYQIIFSDLVQWVNRMNLERLIKCFFKPEVMIAVPQVATEGETPILVYAGAGINNLSLNGSYFKGRLQAYQGNHDMAWTNYTVSMLTPYCMAIRKEVWKDLLPFHSTVITAQHLANEISFLCMKKGIVCEFCAQSSVWVKKDVGNYDCKNPDTGEIILNNIDKEVRMSGHYWHLLKEYGDLIQEKKLEIPCLLRSYKQHLKEDFQAFGLRNITGNGNKSVLVLTHELSLTGAPLVLIQAVKVLIQSGFDVLVVSPENGPLKETYMKMNVPVIIDPQIQSEFGYIKIAYDFNFVIVSTVVLWECIEAFSKTSLPVLWWVHDSRIGYENYLRYVLPETIGENILLYCGGDYAQKVITEYRPLYPASILLYGVEDFSSQIPKTVDRKYWNLPEDKMIFANIGQITQRKGQDILVKAIHLMPKEILRNCVFIFVGTVIDRGIYKSINELQEVYPQNIVYIKQMPYDLLKEFYREIDGVICSSIDDPLPAFVSEALLMSRLCICSSNTAFRSIITSGENGYLFESGNAEELSSIICEVVRDTTCHHDIKQKARKLYETTFAPEIFFQNFTDIIKEKLLHY